jgi:methyl-accepting chemotaxis protein
MAWLKNLPVSRKFTIAFGIVCGLCIVLGTYTFLTFRAISAKSEVVSGKHFPALIQISDVRNGINAERREDLELMLCQTPACSADHNAKRQKAITDYQNGLKAMEGLLIPEEVPQYQKFMAAIKQYQDASDHSVGLLNIGKPGDAVDILSSDAVVASLGDALAAADSGFQMHAKLGADASQGATFSGTHATWVASGATLLIVLLCAITGGILTRLIAPPLEAATAALERVAEKDLTASVEETGTDELGRLTTALNTSVAAMREVLQSVAQGAETLSAATTEISARAVQQSGNASSQ